jgi:hypothetical protein
MLNDYGVRRLAIAVLQQAIADLQRAIPEYRRSAQHSWRGERTSINFGARSQA